MSKTPRLKITKAQWIHTAMHSAKYPVTLVMGFLLGGYQGILLVGIGAVVGYAFEITSDLLYWRAINLRPKSGSMQNVEPLGSGDCIQCGHAVADHDLKQVWQIECSVCGCTYIE